MYVPNYIPEPLEVPGNVAQEPYPLRVAFIRRVTVLHCIGLALVAGVNELRWPTTWLGVSFAVLATLMILLDVVRILRRGRPVEPRLSTYALPIVLLTAGWCVHDLTALGFPMWAIWMGPTFALGYTLLCGRDYSFVGCFALSVIGSSIAVAWVANGCQMPRTTSATALTINAVYLAYFTYDLAALLARRRRGEEFAAVVDLYRDVFNLFGYIPRVISHWRKHRIWNAR